VQVSDSAQQGVNTPAQQQQHACQHPWPAWQDDDQQKHQTVLQLCNNLGNTAGAKICIFQPDLLILGVLIQSN